MGGSKAARAQCGQRFPLCGTIGHPSFSGNGAIGSSCAAYCLLHTSVLCHVNKQLSECSRVTGMHAGALYQSFFSTIWNCSRNRGRERDKLSLFHQSQSLSLTHTRIRKHQEQLSGQLIQFVIPQFLNLQYILPNTNTRHVVLHSRCFDWP